MRYVVGKLLPSGTIFRWNQIARTLQGGVRGPNRVEFYNPQTLETKTFTWRLRPHLVTGTIPAAANASTLKNSKSSNLANTNWQSKSNLSSIPSINSQLQQEEHFLRYQEFEIEVGQSLGLHSIWSLFIVSCGTPPRSSTNIVTSTSPSDSDYIGLFLRNVIKPAKHQQPVYLFPNMNDEEVVVKYKMEVMDREGEVLYTKEGETGAKDKLEIGCWDWRKIVPVAKFHCCGNPSLPGGNNSSDVEDALLLARVSFTMINRRKDTGKTRMPTPVRQNSEEESSTLEAANAFLDLVTSEKSLEPNVTFEVTNRRKFMVHSQILKARSPVFLKMLTADMTEKSGVIKLDDISGNTLELVLKHIYTGQLEEDWTSNPVTVTELIDASEKYWLPALKEFCNKHLVRAATKNNCYKLMEVAQLHNLDKATDDLMAFVSEGLSSTNNSRKPSEESVELKT